MVYHRLSRFGKKLSQAQMARTHQLAPSTVQFWVKKYREKGLAGLAHARRSDKGSSRRLPEQAIRLVEGLALQNPIGIKLRAIRAVSPSHPAKVEQYWKKRLCDQYDIQKGVCAK